MLPIFLYRCIATDIIQLNTSSLGQNIIEFTPTTTTAEIAQGAKAAQNLTFSDTPVANTTTDLATRTNDPLAPLESWFAGLFNNATATVDGGLSSAEASLIKELLDSIGLQDYYALHLLNTCSGSLSGTHDSDFTANKCVSYSDETGGKSSPLHLLYDPLLNCYRSEKHHKLNPKLLHRPHNQCLCPYPCRSLLRDWIPLHHHLRPLQNRLRFLHHSHNRRWHHLPPFFTGHLHRKFPSHLIH